MSLIDCEHGLFGGCKLCMKENTNSSVEEWEEQDLEQIFRLRPEQIRPFIKNLLALQRKELIEKVRKEFWNGATRDEVHRRLDALLCPCPLSCGDNPPCGSCIGWHELKGEKV